MPRRTPILAIILAPVALYIAAILWKQTLVPLYHQLRYSETVAQWRLGSENAAARISAIKDLGVRPRENSAAATSLLLRLQTDDSIEVRKAAAEVLGRMGSVTHLTDATRRGLGELVVNVEDDAMLAVVMKAVGQSAPNNRYPDEVIERIARIFTAQHHPSLYSQAAKALGELGAAQPLPAQVVAELNRLFTESTRRGEREELANAFTTIAKGGRLQAATLDIIAKVYPDEPNRRIRIAILYALAHSAADYPAARELMVKATTESDRDIVTAAQSGMRIIEAERIFAGTDPLSLALDTARPVEERVQSLGIIRSTTIEPRAFAPIVSLARDPQPKMAIAALEVFRHLARDADDVFDRGVLIPALERAMTNADPLIRKAAFSAFATISAQRTSYLDAAGFPLLLDAGIRDENAEVRLIVLVTRLRGAGSNAARDAVIARALADPDPTVRANAVGWLASTKSARREAFLTAARDDPDPTVRAAVATSQQRWSARDRAWPIELWQHWRAGEHAKVGMTIFVAVTVAAPVLLCGSFLLYYMARLLTYLQQRRWRTIAVISVMGVWGAASYGMFVLYFIAALTGDSDTGETLVLAGTLWIAIIVYGALGWGLHYAARD